MTTPIRIDRPLLRFQEGVEDPFSGAAREISPSKDSPSFGDFFKRAMNDASDLQTDAQEMIRAYMRGEPVELHQVMAAAEESSISLELLVEIRNKLTEAYRTVMNMQ
jgi:flagellar hook-basal body complex protein FliE